MLREHIAAIDTSVLRDLFYAAQTALNDVNTVERVAIETGLDNERIEALVPIAIHLSMDQEPDLKTEHDIAILVNKIIELKREVLGQKASFDPTQEDIMEI